MQSDLLIPGGMVHDGSGAPTRRADVALTGACIRWVGNARVPFSHAAANTPSQRCGAGDGSAQTVARAR